MLENNDTVVSQAERDRYKLIVKDRGLMKNDFYDLTLFSKGPKAAKTWQEIRKDKREKRKLPLVHLVLSR